MEASQGNGPSLMSLWPVLSSLIKISMIIVTLILTMVKMIKMCGACQQRRCRPQAKFQPRQASGQPGQIIIYDPQSKFGIND